MRSKVWILAGIVISMATLAGWGLSALSHRLGARSDVRFLQFSEDGGKLLGAGSGVVQLWHLDRAATWHVRTASPDAVLTPDGSAVLHGEGSQVLVRDATNGRGLRSRATPTGTAVTQLARSHDGGRMGLVLSPYERTDDQVEVAVWSVPGLQPLHSSTEIEGPIEDLCWAGSRLVVFGTSSAPDSEGLTLWFDDVRSKKRLARISVGSEPPLRVRIAPDGKTVALVLFREETGESRVELRSLEDGTLLGKLEGAQDLDYFPRSPHLMVVSLPALEPGTSDRTGTYAVVRVPEMEVLRTFGVGAASGRTLRISPDEHLLAVGRTWGRGMGGVDLWEIGTGRKLRHLEGAILNYD